MREITIGSLFAGIGGLELGLERAIPGARTIWQVEQDPYARRVLAKHWPQANRSITDVKEVTRETVERPDILVGGFPCPGFSSAGLKRGFENDRSGLWREFVRIIGDVRPRKYLVLENVAALCRGQWLGTILSDLVAPGWMGGCIWDCIPASSVGAPFSGEGRDRCFLVAFSNGIGCLRKGISREPRGQLVGSLARGDSPFTGLSGPAPDHWEDPPGIRRVADGIPDRAHRIRCLGNAVVPQVAEVIGRVICELERTR